MDEDVVRRFLERGVPFTGGPSWYEWQDDCNRLGPQAPKVFLEALRLGDETTHYPALLGLRIFGYEAWGVGDGRARTYKVRKVGTEEWILINPISKPKDWDEQDWRVVGEGTGE